MDEASSGIPTHSIGDDGDTTQGAPTRTTAIGQFAGHDRTGTYRVCAGAEVGPYTLVRLIGEGSFGEVWLADQREPVRRAVAVKFLHLARLGSWSHFRHEQQTLAMMEHPGLARFIDAGVTVAGQPYFVMQYVPGTRLDAYCDRERLSLEDRLTLFASVCDAVHHAHQKGVVHRDLKPTNILVVETGGRAPQPVILDFGIAKAMMEPLSSQAESALIGNAHGTWGYMSPEQCEGRTDIDTRSDIYSLGAILYELLCGARPFDEPAGPSAREAWTRLICEADVLPPASRFRSLAAERRASIAQSRRRSERSLHRALHSDLGWIPLVALKRIRGQRYESAAHLAADIRRRIEGAPLAAAPASMSYRLQKLVRRRLGTVAGSLAAFAALAIGLFVAILQRGEALRAEHEASWARYRTAITAAQRELDVGDIASIRRALDDCPDAYRTTWEYRYLLRRCDSSSEPPLLHDGRWATHVITSSSGARTAAVTSEGRVSVWRGTSPTVDRTFDVPPPVRDPRGWSDALALAASGSFDIIAAGFADHRVLVWTNDGGPLPFMAFDHAGPVASVDIDDRGSVVATASHDFTGRVVRLDGKDPTSFELIGHQRALRSVRISPNGALAITASDDGTARLWSTSTGRCLATSPKHDSSVLAAEFLPAEADGEGVAALLVLADGSVLRWASDGREEKLAPPCRDQVVALALSAMDGEAGFLAAFGTSDGSVVAYPRIGSREGTSRATPQLLSRRPGRDVRCLALSPTERRLAVGDSAGRVELWKLAPEHLLEGELRGHTAAVMSLVFSSDGAALLSASQDGSVRRWSVGDAVEVSKSAARQLLITASHLCPDRKTALLGTSQGAILVVPTDPATATSLPNQNGAITIKVASGPIRDVSVAGPPSDQIAAGIGRTVARIDLTKTGADVGQQVDFAPDLQSEVTAVSLSEDGHELLAGCADGSLWRRPFMAAAAALWSRVPAVASSPVRKVTLSPDGRQWAVGREDGAVSLLSTMAGSEPIDLPTQPEVKPVATLTWSRKADRLFVGRQSGAMDAYDTRKRELATTLELHTAQIRTAMMSGDLEEERLLTASADGSVVLWDAARGTPLLHLVRGANEIQFAVFLGADERIIAADAAGVVWVWTPAAPAPPLTPQ